jgi:sulfate adenylyltransferase subunit 1
VPLAFAPQSVTLRLADDVDVSRGDVIVAAERAPEVTQDVVATVCHIADRPLRAGDRVLLRHGTATVKAVVRTLDSTLNLETLRRDPGPAALHANDIGQVTLRTATALPLDDYADHRRTGSFLLIDDADGTTLTAGMVGVPLGTED